MEALLDTNFIISCVLKRIDFIEEIQNLGLKPILPREVFQELKDLKKSEKVSHAERAAIDVAFEILEKSKIKKMKVGGAYADDGLIAKGKLPNTIVISNAKNSLILERK